MVAFLVAACILMQAAVVHAHAFALVVRRMRSATANAYSILLHVWSLHIIHAWSMQIGTHGHVVHQPMALAG